MDLARHQHDPTRNLLGILFVVVLHALLAYALVSGLARQAVEVVTKPMTTTIIEDIKVPPPPPPPVRRPPEAPKRDATPPPPTPYVPPPEEPVPVQPRDDLSIAPTPEPPPAPDLTEPRASPAPVSRDDHVAPAPPRRNLVPVERVEPSYPGPAIRAGISNGRVLARVSVDELGNVTRVTIVTARPPRYFDDAVRLALMQWKFRAEGEKYEGEVEVVFTLRD